MRPCKSEKTDRDLPARVFLLSALGLVAACGGATPPPGEPTAAPTEEPRRARGGPSIESEIGALDEGKAQAAFEQSLKKLTGCFHQGVQRLPYLAGTANFYVRVDADGNTRFTYLRDSTIGDRTTEACMLRVLQGTHWPKPVGGQEGEAKNEFRFDGGDERPPVDWRPEQLGAAFEKAKGALSQCRKDAGTGPVKATLYIETDGKPAAVGVSLSDEKGDAAVDCIVDTLKALTFPSPGSYAAKVSVVID